MRVNVFVALRVKCIRWDVTHHLFVSVWHVQIGIFIRVRWFAGIPCAMTLTIETVDSAQVIFQFFRVDGGTQFASVFHEFI